MSKYQGYLFEAFVSYQGEGPWVGVRQCFLRLAGCGYGCRYCDTPQARNPRPGVWRLRLPGQVDEVWPNPIEPDLLADLITRLLPQYGPWHSLAVTGGEPLEQPAFLLTFAAALHKRLPHLPLWLETNAVPKVTPRSLRRAFDYFSVDLKLRSATGRPSPKGLEGWLRNLSPRNGCLKLVVTPTTQPDELVHAARLGQHAVPEWDLVVQPEASVDWTRSPAAARLQTLLQLAEREHRRVRLIPQMHPLLGIR